MTSRLEGQSGSRETREKAIEIVQVRCDGIAGGFESHLESRAPGSD